MIVSLSLLSHCPPHFDRLRKKTLHIGLLVPDVSNNAINPLKVFCKIFNVCSVPFKNGGYDSSELIDKPIVKLTTKHVLTLS